MDFAASSGGNPGGNIFSAIRLSALPIYAKERLRGMVLRRQFIRLLAQLKQ
jgi:hypothetical protein